MAQVGLSDLKRLNAKIINAGRLSSRSKEEERKTRESIRHIRKRVIEFSAAECALQDSNPRTRDLRGVTQLCPEGSRTNCGVSRLSQHQP